MSLGRSVVVAISCLLAGAAVAAESPTPGVGVVFQTEFNGALGRLDKDERQLLYTKPVYTNEVVHTGPHSSTALLFLDKTSMAKPPLFKADPLQRGQESDGGGAGADIRALDPTTPPGDGG